MDEFTQCGMFVFNSAGIHHCAAEATRRVSYVTTASAEEGGGEMVVTDVFCDRHSEIIASNQEVLSNDPLAHEDQVLNNEAGDANGPRTWLRLTRGWLR